MAHSENQQCWSQGLVGGRQGPVLELDEWLQLATNVLWALCISSPPYSEGGSQGWASVSVCLSTELFRELG